MGVKKLGIQVKELKFSFEEKSWDCEFDFSLEENDCFGIIGSSGSGKSVLLNLIAGFFTPTNGKIIIQGKDYTNIKPSNRPILIMFQEHNLFSHLNVFENIAIAINPSLNLKAHDRKMVEEALDRLGLKGFNNRLPIQLSGGQRQRVAIARIMVRRAPIILLDEPFSFLDPPLQVEMLDIIKEIQRERKLTVIMVTHDFNDCIRICNKTAFMDHGRLIYQDTTKEFIKNGHNIPKVNNYLNCFKT